MIPHSSSCTDNPMSNPQLNTGMIKSDNFNLNIAIINCQSVMAKRACFHNFIAASCESWLSSLIQSAEVFPNDLKIYRRDRLNGYGGVFIACQETLINKELVHEENLAAVIFCIIKRYKPLIICCVHRPPNNDILCMENLCNLQGVYLGIVRNNCDCPIWIVGDINLPNSN